VSEALYPVLAINSNQPKGSVHKFFTRTIVRVCHYTHVMDYNFFLLRAVVLRHRNTLITLTLLRITICYFHVRLVWSTFTN